MYPASTYLTLFYYQQSSVPYVSISINTANGKINFLINNVTLSTGTFVHTFVTGDLWSWRLSYNGTTYQVAIYKNNVYQYTEVITGSAPTYFPMCYFGSTDVGTYQFSTPVVFLGAS
jgi:hypothetical protein